jgi:hypothetical protein
MVGPVNIVMLLTDGFGGFGGISKLNRDFMQALDATPQPVGAWCTRHGSLEAVA